MAALVEGDDVMVARQRRRHLVEAVRRLRSAVQQEHGRRTGGAPIESVQADATGREQAIARMWHVPRLHRGGRRRQTRGIRYRSIPRARGPEQLGIAIRAGIDFRPEEYPAMSETMLDERGRAVETVTATAAKNAFGTVLETALSRGVVAITKRNAVRAVVLSAERYEALLNSSSQALARLESEFGDLVAAMQTPRRARPATRSSPRSPPRSGGRGAGRPQACLTRGRASWSSPGPTAPARAASAAPSSASRVASTSIPTRSRARSAPTTRASTRPRRTAAPGPPAAPARGVVRRAQRGRRRAARAACCRGRGGRSGPGCPDRGRRWRRVV